MDKRTTILLNRLSSDKVIQSLKNDTERKGNRLVNKKLSREIEKYTGEPSERSAGAQLLDVSYDIIDSGTTHIKHLLTTLHIVVPALFGDAGPSIQTFYWNIRKRIAAHHAGNISIMSDAYELMAYDRTRWRRERTEAAQALEWRNTHQMIFTIEEIERAISAFLNEKNPYGHALICELCCGARISEVLARASFIKKNSDTIIQIGTAKCDPNYILTIEKPVVYITADKLIDLVESVRHTFGINPLSTKEQSNAIASQLNKQINITAGTMLPGATSHTFRKLYACMAYEYYGKPAGINQQHYINKILGHAPHMLGASYHYSDVAINFNRGQSSS